MNTHTSDNSRRSGAFTLIEVLVVVIVIAILLSIVLVAFNGVRRSAERFSAERFLATIGQAVESFKADLGYYPPLLTHDRTPGDIIYLGNDPPEDQDNPSVIVPDSWNPFGSAIASPLQIRGLLEHTRYGSEFTLSVYLLGSGDIDNSEQPDDTLGTNSDDDDGKAGPGFRDPGPDRSWGGAGDRAAQIPTGVTKVGRVYGPYLDADSISKNLKLDPRTGLFRIVDQWGQPVRYYRDWPTKDRPDPPAQPELSVDFVPVELRTADALREQLESPTPDKAVLELEGSVFNAPYALLSAGKPVLFSTDPKRSGEAIPLFGDRQRDALSVANAQRLEDLPLIQQLNRPFRPAMLSQEAQENLLADLESNVRYVP